MTFADLLIAGQTWAADHALAIGAATVLFPVLTTGAAAIAKGGKTDEDGVFIANVAVAFSLALALAAALWVMAANLALDTPWYQLELPLLLAPTLILAGTVFGVSKVFPLARLSSMQRMQDIVAFAVFVACSWWFLSHFRGWGIIFWGGVGTLILLFALAGLAFVVLLRRMFRERR